MSVRTGIFPFSDIAYTVDEYDAFEGGECGGGEGMGSVGKMCCFLWDLSGVGIKKNKLGTKNLNWGWGEETPPQK